MLKIDLHIHTDPASYENSFVFSLDKLEKYVHNNGLQVIAITNHNHFNKDQFLDIQNKLSDIVVLPGVEIDIENSHLLLVGNVDQVEEINYASGLLSNEIKSENDCISFDKFIEIFPEYEKYLLIPHYKKNPAMQTATLNKFSGNLVCGEVRSAKKFEVIAKQSGKLVPVLFSDIRISDDLEVFPTRNTYVDISDFEFAVLKLALSDKNKVFVNDLKNDYEFEILPDGTTASSKLNVIIGKRSSGKTFNLDRINASSDENNIKYIKQFSLTGNSEKTKFDELVNNEQTILLDQYLAPFKSLTDNVLEIDQFFDSGVDNYLTSLKEYAENQSLKDSYSKSKLFTETCFNANDNYDTRDVIKAILKLLETEHNRELVDEYLDRIALEKLLKVLLRKRQIEYRQFKLKEEVDKIIEFTKSKLSEKSSLKSIKDVNLYEIEKKRIIINEYNELCNQLKDNALIKTLDVYRFKVELYKTKFKNVTEVKKILKTSNSLVEAFRFYDKPFIYIKELEKSQIDKSKIYKAIVNFKISVLNERNTELSGGERAEYNLLHELKSADNYDILLLDEPEASFDNPFIKTYIVDIIKKISNKTTVFLSTHNNTLGMLLKPNKIIYTEACDNDIYKVFTGDFGAKYLKSRDGETRDTYDHVMDVMEAGETAYKERSAVYKSIKNS